MEKEILEVLLKNNGVIAIRLYGSSAKGKATKDSDVDVAILFERGAVPQKMELIQMREEIADAIGKDVDLLCLNDASPIIAMQVAKEGKTIYLGSEKAYHDYLSKLITEYSDLKILRKPMEENILKRKYYG